MSLFGQIQRRQGQRGHTLQRDQIALFEGVGVIGEQFEEAAHLARPAQQGQNNDGGDAERAAGFEIHAWIGFRIIAAQQLAAGNAFAGQPGPDLKARADRGRTRSGAGAANHFVSLREGERGSGGSRNVLRALDQELERGFQFALF
jgi:hypothetical protein